MKNSSLTRKVAPLFFNFALLIGLASNCHIHASFIDLKRSSESRPVFLKPYNLREVGFNLCQDPWQARKVPNIKEGRQDHHIKNAAFIKGSPQDKKGQIQAIFEQFLNMKTSGDSIDLVIGCGKEHRNLTVAGNLHDHEGAFTIDQHGGPLNPYGVTHPHLQADVLEPGVLTAFPKEAFNKVTFEHIHPALFHSPGNKRYLLSEVHRMLAKEGKLIFLSGGIEHDIIPLEEVVGGFKGAGFEVEESSFFKKLPDNETLERFKSCSKEEKTRLVYQALRRNDATLWRALTSEERLLYQDPLFENYAYFKIVATKLSVPHGQGGLLDLGDYIDSQCSTTEEITEDKRG